MSNNVRKGANASTADCAAFQNQLPSLFESGADLNTDPHLQACEKCSALVQDLEYIAQQAKLLLPIHDPSPEVWNNIQSALKKESKEPSRAE
jgi:hypothetical protein